MRWSEPTPAGVQQIAARLRHQDRLEVLYSHQLTAEQAVYNSWRNSSICRCIDADDGQPVGLCGVNRTLIWLLGTDQLLATASHRRQFIRGGRRWVDDLLQSGRHQLLENWALASNTATLRWLKHLGFTVETPAPMGRSCQLFSHFWREA
jgi:hypothetical protein